MQGLGESPRRSRREIGAMVLVFIFFLFMVATLIPSAPKDLETDYCPQVAPLQPQGHFENASVFFEESYKKKSVDLLRGAVQIPTVSYDDLKFNVTDEPRLEIFFKLHDYLEHSFPKVYKHSKLDKINTYGLLYTFEGSNTDLKPIVLMAHQDVVPVNPETLDKWDHPPFEGYFDGEFIYGRGTSDTKTTLIAYLEALESLLSQGWWPERTVLVSFGFDEEISGHRGAAFLAAEIEDRYGKDSIEVIIDEGFGIGEAFGSHVAAPTVAEKGYIDVKYILHTPGGHSSLPPDHTGIGIMSQLAALLEDHPFSSSLEDDHPLLSMLRCHAEHTDGMSKEFRRTILDLEVPAHRGKLLDYINQRPELRYLIRTSQAIDVIKGGVKVNALPETVEMTVNHRVAIDSSIDAVMQRAESLAMHIAHRHNLAVVSQGETVRDPGSPYGLLEIINADSTAPAPISPFEGVQWDLIAGVTRHIFEDVARDVFDIKGDVIVAPSVFPANTDTRHYWNLSRAIYRYYPGLLSDMVDFHTVNERLRFRTHLASVAWYYEFLINATGKNSFTAQ